MHIKFADADFNAVKNSNFIIFRGTLICCYILRKRNLSVFIHSKGNTALNRESGRCSIFG